MQLCHFDSLFQCPKTAYCGQITLRPALSKSCTQNTVPGPQPSAIVPQSSLPPPQSSSSGYNSGQQVAQIPTYAPPAVQQQSLQSRMVGVVRDAWREYPIPIIGIPVALILLLTIVLFLLHHIHTHKPAVNQDQLHTYVQQEAKSGMSPDAIRKNLQSSGWNDTEISKALSNINTNSGVM